MSQGIKRDDLDQGSVIPSKLGSELMRRTISVNVGDIAADSDAIKHCLYKIPAQMTAGITIKRILLSVDTAITAADTNYQTVNITDGTNTIATVDTGPASGGQDFVVGTPVALTLDADYVAQDAGNVITMEFSKTSSGMTMSALTAQIDFEINDPS